MIKWLLKLMMPSADDISTMFAETCAKAINDSGKADKIAIYAAYVEKWDNVQDKILQWLNDGKIDENEKKELAAAMKPIVEKILAEIKK